MTRSPDKGTHKHKQMESWNILAITDAFLDQKRVNVCEQAVKMASHGYFLKVYTYKVGNESWHQDDMLAWDKLKISNCPLMEYDHLKRQFFCFNESISSHFPFAIYKFRWSSKLNTGVLI